MKKKIKIFAGLIFIFLLGIIVYPYIINKNENSGNGIDPQMDYGSLDEIVFDVKTEKVKTGDLILSVTANGIVKANKELDVMSNINGTITDVYIYEGKWVAANDLLLKLDDREYKIALKEAKDKLIEAKVEYGFLTKEAPVDTAETDVVQKINEELKKLETMYKNGQIEKDKYLKKKDELETKLLFTGAKRNDLILNKSGYSRAINALEKAKLNLSYTEIRAPFAGVVGDFNLVVGQHITSNKPLFKLFDINTIKLYVNVLEDEINKIKRGNSVRIEINALPGKEYVGKVIYVSPFINPDNKTGKVIIKIKNVDGKIKPGMFANAKIEVERLKNRILVPKEALLVRDRRNLVFTVQDSLAKWKYVKIGKQNDKYIEILSGVSPGEDVIIKGQYNLAHDAKVRVRN